MKKQTISPASLPPAQGLESWLWFGAFALCTLVMYWPLLAGEKFLWFDAVDHGMVKVWLVCKSLASGRIPLWDPCQHGGHPVLGDQTYAIFYPIHVLLALLGKLTGSITLGAINVAVVLETLCGGAGVFVMGRRALGLRGRAAFVAATVFMFSLPAVGRVFQYLHYTEIVMIPWMLLGAMALRKGSWVFATGMAALWAATLLGSNLQYSYFMAVAVGIWALVDMVSLAHEERRMGPVAALLGKYVFVFVAGLALAAVDLVPKLEYTQIMSPRLDRDLSGWGTPVKYFVTYLVPGWFGTVAGGPAPYFGKEGFWNYYEFAHYAGIVTLVLAAVGLWMLPKNRTWWFLAILIVFGWVYAYGVNNPLPSLLPLGDKFRFPAKFLVFNAFAFALLAGGVTDQIGRGTIAAATLRRIAIAAIIACAVVCAALWIARMADTRPAPQDALIARGILVGAGLAALTCGMLWLCGNGTNAAQWAVTALAVIAACDMIGHTRAFNLGDPAQSNPASPHLYGRAPYVDAWLDDMRNSLFRIHGSQAFDGKMRGTFYGLHTLEGNMTSTIRWYARVRGGGGIDIERMLDLFNVKYAVRIDEQGGRIVTRTTQVPRAYVVRNIEVVSESNIITRLYERSFDPQATMLVTPEFGELRNMPTGAAPDKVAVTSYANERIGLAVELASPGYVVLNENRYPGWEVTVDGAPAHVIHANYAFRGVQVPAGSHTVVWSYRPRSLRVGAGISLAAVAGCAAFVALPVLLRRFSSRSAKGVQ